MRKDSGRTSATPTRSGASVPCSAPYAMLDSARLLVARRMDIEPLVRIPLPVCQEPRRALSASWLRVSRDLSFFSSRSSSRSRCALASTASGTRPRRVLRGSSRFSPVSENLSALVLVLARSVEPAARSRVSPREPTCLPALTGGSLEWIGAGRWRIEVGLERATDSIFWCF